MSQCNPWVAPVAASGDAMGEDLSTVVALRCWYGDFYSLFALSAIYANIKVGTLTLSLVLGDSQTANFTLNYCHCRWGVGIVGPIYNQTIPAGIPPVENIGSSDRWSECGITFSNIEVVCTRVGWVVTWTVGAVGRATATQ